MSILPRWSGIMSNNSPNAILKYLLSKKRKIYFSVKCYFIRTFCFLKKKLLVSNFCQQFIECWTPLVNNFFINKIFYLKSLFVIFTWESPNLKFLLWRHKIATHICQTKSDWKRSRGTSCLWRQNFYVHDYNITWS